MRSFHWFSSSLCRRLCHSLFFCAGLRSLVDRKQCQGGGVPHKDYYMCMSSGGWCPGPDDGSRAETYEIMPPLLGNQSCLLRAPFCCSTRYRFVRKKLSFRVSLASRPPFPQRMQSCLEYFCSADGTLNIEVGGGGGDVEERFFRTSRGPEKERFFRTPNEEN